MVTFIFALILGAVLVLTVENTVLLHYKPKKPVHEPTEEEKRREDDERRDAEEWQNLMDYKGRER